MISQLDIQLMSDKPKCQVDKQLDDSGNTDKSNQLLITIKLNNKPYDNIQLYMSFLRNMIYACDHEFGNCCGSYNKTLLQHFVENQLENLSKVPIQKKCDMSVPDNNILELKRQVDSIFSKFLPLSNDSVSENTDGLDLDLLDKIEPLVPEGKEILLKNIVKELNGSAKGLSDFVIIFTKYRNAIINHNGIEYFQRKGCHFLRKI